jgi:hypothetical protein
MAYNNIKFPSSDFSPAYLQFGHDAWTTVPALAQKTTPPVRSDPAANYLKRIETDMKTAKSHLEAAKERQRKYADLRRHAVELRVGDQVLMSTANLNDPSIHVRKRRSRFIHSARVSSEGRPTMWPLLLALPAHTYQDSSNVPWSVLRLYRESTKFKERATTSPLRVQVKFHEECFCKERITRGKSQFLVRWTGHPDSGALWRDAAELEGDMPRYYPAGREAALGWSVG